MPDGNDMNSPRIHKLSISKTKGERKRNVDSVRVLDDGGFEGDVHAGTFRAISLLPIERFPTPGDFNIDIRPGDFAENITTTGLDFSTLEVGDRVACGEAVVLEIVQIGKECHDTCSIGEALGDCIMPRHGLFARAISGGRLREGDPIRIL